MMLYHDDICAMKRQYMYDKRIEEIQTMMSSTYPVPIAEDAIPTRLSNVDGGVRSVGSGQSFCQFNVKVQCKVLSEIAKVPTKTSGLTYIVHACTADPLTVPPSGHAVVRTGVQMCIPQGWIAMTMNVDSVRDNLLVVCDMIDSHRHEELCIHVYNMTDKAIIVNHHRPVARLVFQKNVDAFHVHMDWV